MEPEAPGTRLELLSTKLPREGMLKVAEARNAPLAPRNQRWPVTASVDRFWSTTTETWVAELLKRGTSPVVSKALMRYTSAASQSVVQPPLWTRTDSSATVAAVAFSQRRLRLAPAPAGTEVWTTLVPPGPRRSTRGPEL